MLSKFKASKVTLICIIATIIFISFIFISFIISFAETVTYTYDDLGRLIKADYGNGVVKEYKYDDAGNRVELLSAQKISVSPSSKDFGSVNVGSSSTPQTFKISNTGTANLHVSGMALSDTTNYSFNTNGGSNPCGSTTPTITPNSNCTVAVTFSPSSAGPKDANLTISSDDPDTPTLNLPLSGIGIPVVECNLVPDGTVIPRGGTLGFQATVTNNTDEVQVFKFATRITKPNGGKYPPSGYLKGPVWVRLAPHDSGSKHISHFIPSTAPLGMYTYHGYVGRSGVLYHECQFDFRVTAE
jgi:YD repeat-containing protein